MEDKYIILTILIVYLIYFTIMLLLTKRKVYKYRNHSICKCDKTLK